MKTGACVLFALLLARACLREAECSPPTEVTGETGVPRQSVTGRHRDDIRSGVSTGHRDDIQSSVTSGHRDGFHRLPGLCRRLRRRRLSYLHGVRSANDGELVLARPAGVLSASRPHPPRPLLGSRGLQSVWSRPASRRQTCSGRRGRRRPLLAAGGVCGDRRVLSVRRLPDEDAAGVRPDGLRGEGQLHQVQPRRVQELPLGRHGGTPLLEIRGGRVVRDGVVGRLGGPASAPAGPSRLGESPPTDRVHLAASSSYSQIELPTLNVSKRTTCHRVRMRIASQNTDCAASQQTLVIWLRQNHRIDDLGLLQRPSWSV
ncbi:protein JTB isoform X2 [Phyllopteryx taeniolatus]|uniref:protein JTB isoform X2 n=1 Tax=Phyllopteryx taeniolatus TaxID=161469 RepID=UPI002AD24D9B|nr:protein JTB isoform X2 [Phyllopteryx taeniolatus]